MGQGRGSPFLDRVREVLRVRHYSYRTEQTYIFWVRRFILFHHKTHPEQMGEAQVASFLTPIWPWRGACRPAPRIRRSMRWSLSTGMCSAAPWGRLAAWSGPGAGPAFPPCSPRRRWVGCSAACRVSIGGTRALPCRSNSATPMCARPSSTRMCFSGEALRSEVPWARCWRVPQHDRRRHGLSAAREPVARTASDSPREGEVRCCPVSLSTGAPRAGCSSARKLRPGRRETQVSAGGPGSQAPGELRPLLRRVRPEQRRA